MRNISKVMSLFYIVFLFTFFFAMKILCNLENAYITSSYSSIYLMIFFVDHK